MGVCRETGRLAHNVNHSPASQASRTAVRWPSVVYCRRIPAGSFIWGLGPAPARPSSAPTHPGLALRRTAPASPTQPPLTLAAVGTHARTRGGQRDGRGCSNASERTGRGHLWMSPPVGSGTSALSHHVTEPERAANGAPFTVEEPESRAREELRGWALPAWFGAQRERGLTWGPPELAFGP